MRQVQDRGQYTRFVSPLRYPGGKAKLANFLKLLLQENGLGDVHYVEPYAGGASVALELLFEEYASHIHINDLNRSLYAFWKSALDEPDALCQRIADVSVNIEEWERQRAVQDDLDTSILDLGFSTFFLNRTNRSGIITGGVIGGRKQSGRWKLDVRFTKDSLIHRIQKIGRYRSRISLHNTDALLLLEQLTPTLPHNSLLYLDPPYYDKGQGLYQNAYAKKDHAELAEAVRLLPRLWMVSYDFHPDLLELYAGIPTMTYGLSYTAQNKYEGRELLFFGPGLDIPEVATPAKIPLREVLA